MTLFVVSVYCCKKFDECHGIPANTLFLIRTSNSTTQRPNISYYEQKLKEQLYKFSAKSDQF